MSKIESLRKALDKAFSNGFAWDTLDGEYWNELTEVEKVATLRLMLQEDVYFSIIYKPAFAVAVWGETANYRQDGHYRFPADGWEHHISRMVVSPDPLKYLGEHV